MFFRQVYDPCLFQYAYFIVCQKTKEAIVIDPERDVDRYLSLADEYGFDIVAVAETHIHADFLSGARQLAEQVGAKLYLSAEGEDKGWSSKWAKEGNYRAVFLKHADRFNIGNIQFSVISTPGHTPEHIVFVVTDSHAATPMGIVSGDFLFVGDVGRPDLLEEAAKIKDTKESSAKDLYDSIQKLLSQFDDDYLMVWPAHGAGSACGKGLSSVSFSSLGYEKRTNPALRIAKKQKEEFVNYILKDQPDPPLYFARMKAQNRDGVPVFKHLPKPQKLSVQELDRAVKEKKFLILDTREDRKEFLSHHLPGALFVPFTNQFCTIAGSLIEDEKTPILLVVSSDHEEEAIRRLVRIGYDKIEAMVSLETFSRYLERGGQRESISSISAKQIEDKRGVQIVDVRYKSEYDQKHFSNAIHAPYTRLPEYVNHIPKDKPLVVHCQSGFRASVASAFLKHLGYQVFVVNENISEVL